MSRKAFADRSSWKTPRLYAFTGGYGPFKPKGHDAIEDVLVVLWHERASEKDRGRHPMHGVAGVTQEILLRNDTKSPFKSILILDIRTMTETDTEGGDPTTNSANEDDALKTALQAEVESPDLVKGFGKSLLRLFERLRLRNVGMAAYGGACPLLLKLVQALNQKEPDTCSSVWLFHPDLPTKFVNTHWVQRRQTAKDRSMPMNVIFETETAMNKRLQMIRCAYPAGFVKVVPCEPAMTCTSHLLTVALSTSQESEQKDIAAYDPDYCNYMGECLFLSNVTVEMSPYTKQYERHSEEITANLLEIIKAEVDVDEPMSIDSMANIDWSTVERHFGALILRGNRCVLVRSLKGDWSGMRIPSVKPLPQETQEQAVLRSVVEFTEVDAKTEVMLLPHIAPVMVYAPNNRPLLVELHAVYATEPPPEGPLEDADLEDDESPYDWYTFQNAASQLDQRSVAALRTISSALVEAANVGILPCKWGGVFGQEAISKATTECHDCEDCETAAAPKTMGKALTAPLEEWQPSRQADVLQDVRKASNVLARHQVHPAEEEKKDGAEAKKLPVTVLSGFLGSGKTTLLSHILSNYEGLRVALLVNDMAEINIDAALVQKTVSVRQREEHMVELSNGCICCTLREDLLVEVSKIAAEGVYDYLLIESSGVSEPLPVAETFTFEDSTGLQLGDVAKIDTLVTVVDGSRFLQELESLESLRARDWHADPQDERTISHLLCDQVEFANVIVLNKCDLLPSEEEKSKVRRLIQSMNPTAKVVEATYSKVPLDAVLGTGLFSMADAERHEGWLQEARVGEHTPETEEYGISSFTYRATKPFWPHALHKALSEMTAPSTTSSSQSVVLRAKGFVWFANCPQLQGDLSIAGSQCTVLPGNPWWAEIDKADWPKNLERDIAPLWHEPYGDRQQEIVIIGSSLDRDGITKTLEACLLSEDEMAQGQEAWYQLAAEAGDPFEEAWQAAIEALWQEHDHHGHTHDHDV